MGLIEEGYNSFRNADDWKKKLGLESVLPGAGSAYGAVQDFAPNLMPDFLKPTPDNKPAPIAPNIPAFQQYQGAFNNGDQTTLHPDLQAKSPNTIAGPTAFAGTGLAAQEAGTIRGADGNTPWEALLKQRQAGEQSQLSSDVGAQSLSQAEAAKGSLASKGGLRAGSAQRIDLGSARQAQDAQQNVSRQGALGQLGIGAEAEQNRLGTLGNVSQSQQNIWDTTQRLDHNAQVTNANNQFNTEQFNIDNVLGERGRQAASAQEGYNQDINKWIGQVYAGGLGRK